MFPSPQGISILENTTNVTFSCSQCAMIQNLIQNVLTNITNLPFVISVFSEDNEGSYMLLRETPSGIQYTTAHVYITFTSNITIFNTVERPTSSTNNSGIVIPIVVIALIILSIIIILHIIVPIAIKIYYKKWKRYLPPKKTKPIKVMEKARGTSGEYSQFPNDSKSYTERKEYIVLEEIQNRDYMTIDEASIIPVQIENLSDNTENPYYSNQAPIKRKRNPSSPQYVQMVNTEDHTSYDKSVSDDDYLPMNPASAEGVITPKPISSRDFPTTYKRYVEAGTERGSNFFEEFNTLNEETKQYDFDSTLTRNSLNPVLLESQFFTCIYINASWLESFEFITSVHPNLQTQQTFLQMIFQTKASMVIMLTTRREKAKIISGITSHVCYWPKKEEPFICEPFESNLINCTETNAFVRQEILLKNTCEGKEHSFIHCLSPIWNEDCTVSDMTWVATLLIRIIKQKQDSPHLPIIIHCEDGFSKTGIIMTALTSVKQMNMTNTIDIFNNVKSLRRQRMKMVPTMVSAQVHNRSGHD